MAVTETFDPLEIVFGEIAFGAPVPVDDVRSEPVLPPSGVPLFVEFGEPVRLDPDRIGLIWELPPAASRPIRLRSSLISLVLHFLPLLAIIGWASPTAEVAMPIPVQLVFEEPPPPPPQPTAPEPKLQQAPHGPLASVDMGDVKPKDLGLTTSMTPPAAGATQLNPADTQTAAAPPPPPLPAAKPAPPNQKSAFQLPKPAGAPVPHREATPHEASRAAQFAGPTASRDEYLAYLVTLTRQHIDLLPRSLIGARRGETVLSVVIHDDGLIGPLSVVRSSGYPDIDSRVEQMVAAVHRAPPLPQWYQGNAIELQFTLKFPEALYLR